jgi:hypothetical protein
MASGPEVAMVVVIALSGYPALYFASRYEKRSPAVVALLSLMGFAFLVDVLWGAVYYVSCVAERAVTFDAVGRSLTVPVLVVSIVGLLRTGLVFLMVVRREVAGRD